MTTYLERLPLASSPPHPPRRIHTPLLYHLARGLSLSLSSTRGKPMKGLFGRKLSQTCVLTLRHSNWKVRLPQSRDDIQHILKAVDRMLNEPNFGRTPKESVQLRCSDSSVGLYVNHNHALSELNSTARWNNYKNIIAGKIANIAVKAIMFFLCSSVKSLFSYSFLYWEHVFVVEDDAAPCQFYVCQLLAITHFLAPPIMEITFSQYCYPDALASCANL